MPARRYFGTDGIRGCLGESPITPEFVLRLGWAAGRVLSRTPQGSEVSGNAPILIGKDTRISGYMLESALESGLSAAGVDIRLLGPMPTPAIAYLARSIRARAGIVISASHNPYSDNGIKFFYGDGSKLSEETEAAIEAELDKPCRVVAPEQLGKASRIIDAPRRYMEFCKDLFHRSLYLDGIHLVVDCAHGATYQIAPLLFEELGAKVDPIGVSPDGFNINRQCGAAMPDALRGEMKRTGADLGIAFDGDGDRVTMVDGKGAVVDGDALLYILARARRERLNGAVVGTSMSSLSLEQALKKLDLALLRARVGDRYIAQLMSREALRLGGESSGHIIDLDYTTTSDGIVTALQILNIMGRTGRALGELQDGLSILPLQVVNLPLRRRIDVTGLPEVKEAVRAVENELGPNGRVLLRVSGTEAVLRILVEGPEAGQVQRLSAQISSAVNSALEHHSC